MELLWAKPGLIVQEILYYVVVLGFRRLVRKRAINVLIQEVRIP